MIVFIHGFGSNGPTSSTGQALVETLPNEIIARVSYDSLNPIADVVSIMQHIKQMKENVTLVGVSLGGFIARYIANNCPNVERLILLNPSLNAPESLKKYEGTIVNQRIVPSDIGTSYRPMIVERDRPELPIYVAVCSDDDVVDPYHTISLYEDRAAMLVTTGGHRIPFNEDVKAFINNAMNVRFG